MKITCKTGTELVLFPVQDLHSFCLLQSWVTQPIPPMSDICIVVDLDFIITRQKYFSQHYPSDSKVYLLKTTWWKHACSHGVVGVFVVFVLHHLKSSLHNRSQLDGKTWCFVLFVFLAANVVSADQISEVSTSLKIYNVIIWYYPWN